MSRHRIVAASQRHSHAYRVPIFAVVVAGITVATVTMALAAAAGKTPYNPWAGLSDQQKQAQIDATHAANVKFLEDFESRGGDPRSLPIIRISTWLPPASSLGAAASQANLIVHGRVDSVHFVANPSGGMPHMSATVTVIAAGKGSAPSSLVVTQTGGPVAQPGGKGALVELSDEDLMLPGDEVLLMLSGTGSSGLKPIYGAGVQFIEAGRLSGETAVRYGTAGIAYQAVWLSLINPNVSTSAYPVQSTSE